MPVVVTINDESPFQDLPGVTYEFDRPRAVALLQTGARVTFYTGGRRSGVRSHRKSPLTNQAHYFAFGIVGTVQGPNETGRFACSFSEYSPFVRPVLLKNAAGEYLEPVAPVHNRRSYFQNGVREVSEGVFGSILQLAGASFDPSLNDGEQSPNVVGTEGGRRKTVISVLERDRALRDRAIGIHGLNCVACGFNFGEFYGAFANGYIHVHHLEMLASFGDRRTVNPETDLTVLCANCHCIVHRRRDQLLSVDELKAMIKAAR